MQIPFHKMEGGGNDFILLAPQYYPYVKDQGLIPEWCDRHLGIGADGLITVDFSASTAADFTMIYHNSDGSSDCFCGNGARCAVAFAHTLQKLPESCTFLAQDGLHTADMHGVEDIEISLRPAHFPQAVEKGWFMNTGSRHFALQVSQPNEIDLNQLGSRWRHHQAFQPAGANVNFWTQDEAGIYLRTFEKGVEAETLACGTGIVAVALIQHYTEGNTSPLVEMPIRMKGGRFQVKARRTQSQYIDIHLRGPVRHVFSGEITIN